MTLNLRTIPNTENSSAKFYPEYKNDKNQMKMQVKHYNTQMLNDCY